MKVSITVLLSASALLLASGTQAAPPESAAAHRAKAVALAAKNDHNGAVQEYRQALALDNAAHSPDAAFDLNSIGEEFYAQGRWQEALDYFQQALTLARGTGTKNEAVAFNDIGMTEGNLGRREEGLAGLRQSLKILRSLGDRQSEAGTLANIGDELQALGRLNDAVVAWGEALNTLHAIPSPDVEEALAGHFASVLYDAKQYALASKFYIRLLASLRMHSDKKNAVITLNNLGACAEYLHQYSQAATFYSQAAALSHINKDAAAEENAVMKLASALFFASRFPEAADAYRRLLVFQREAGDRKAEAETLNTLGIASTRLGQYDKALGYYRQALALRRALGDPAEIAATLGDTGYVYDLMGRTAEALDLYQEALPLCRQAANLSVEANTLSKQGEAYDNLGRFADALTTFEQALALYKKTGDARGEAAAMKSIGGVYYEFGKYRKALEFLEPALARQIEIGDRGGMAATLGDMGSAYNRLGDSDRALKLHQQALRLRRDLGDRAGEANTLNSIAIVYGSLSRHREAITIYKQALPLLRQLGASREEAGALNGLGIEYDKLSQYDTALAYFHQAFILRRKTGDRAGEAATLNSIGVTYDNLSRFDEAIGIYQRALILRRAVGDKDSEAETINNIAAAYCSLSQYARALDFYGQSLRLRRQVGNTAGEATALNNVGVTYGYLSQNDKALDSFQQALVLRRQVGDQGGEADTLGNIGYTYNAQELPASALEYQHQALLLYRRIGDISGEAMTLGNIGAADIALGRYDQALTAFGQALILHHQIGGLSGEANALSNLGVTYNKINKPIVALAYLQRALPLRREVGDRAGEAVTLYDLMVNREQTQPRLAIFYGKQSINVYQSIRKSISALDKESRQTYLASVGAAYRGLAELLISQKRLPEAQQVLRLLKEQEFFDFLGRGQDQNAPPLGNVGLTHREKLWIENDDQISNVLIVLGQQRQSLLRNKIQTAQQRKLLISIDRRIAAAAAKQSLMQRQIAREFSDTVSLTDSHSLPVTAPSLPHAPYQQSVSIYTIVAPDKLLLIVTTRAGQKSHEVPIKASDLYRKVLSLRNALQDPSHDPRPLAQELYKIILGPIEADLKATHATTLLWSLDDALRYLPISALYDGKQYMVERYDNCVLTLAGPSPAARTAPPPWTGLGLGVSQEHPGFDPLPGVRDELAGIFGPVVPGQTLLDAMFTQATFLAGLKRRNHPLVHIASHFALSGRDTESFLLLGDGAHLTMAQMKTDPHVFAGVDLLTLSACNTAMEVRSAGGKEVEGFGALAQRLGARSVLASLWPVADASTPVLMREFYRLRRAHPKQSKASDLRQAQLELLRGQVTPSAAPSETNRAQRAKVAGAANTSLPPFVADSNAPYSHPYYWAPFVLIGNPE
ncbi:MAG: tetratricopeptide repeat protein [Capsulimonas sp.]|uniref:tetratricopeptide repeat protein n=1 Tax=Capsulimonas sp. TaxID=2494211 RepID=UPI003264B2C8